MTEIKNNTTTRTVLITGCSKGIGFSTLKGFLSKGYCVIGHCRNLTDELTLLSQNFPKQLYLVFSDFSEESGVEHLWGQIEKLQIFPDILINNAATKGLAESFEEVSQFQLEHIMRVNVHSPFLLCQKVLPQMKKNKWGRIINISSIGTKFGGGAQTSDYCISKFALEGLTSVLNKQFTSYNILSNTLKVGVTKTDFHQNIKSKVFHERERLIPLKRAAEPTEIFEMIYFLCSPQNSFTSGAVISIAGGE